MAADKEKTLADYVAIAISPALIMALVGSLVFFLVEVLYVGEYQARLLWILFFFVFGAVLVARVSMTGGISERASLYGIVLGLLVWIALQMYVEYPQAGSLRAFGWAVNLGLIAVIWWSAHRLTWDCTLIDDNVDSSGAGLLEAAGLDESQGGHDGDPVPAIEEEPSPAAKKRRKKEPTGFTAWLNRYRRYREQQAQMPHTPGVWVVYFSFATLPIFGLGQSLIPAAQVGRRRYVFWLMVIYVGSGLGLLLTTSFLGLRRYLRHRKLQMPVAMTGVWLTVGAILIGALLLTGALLPRPTAEYPLLELAGLAGSTERKASDVAPKGDSPGKDKGRGTSDKPGQERKDAKGSGKDGSNKEGENQGGGKSSGREGQGKDKDGKGKGDAKGDGAKGDSKSEKAQDAAKSQQGKDKTDAKGDSKSDKAKDDARSQKAKEKTDQPRGSKESAPPNEPPSSPSSSSSEWLSDLGKRLATLLKWIVAILVGLIVAFYLLRTGLKFLANFTDWARRLLEGLRSFWNDLWSWWPSRDHADASPQEVSAPAPPRPFASFRDPFLSGKAPRMSPDELVRYTFEALQAWAVERGLPRQAGETPFEFGHRLGEEFPPLDADLRILAGHYAGLAYARRSGPPECRETLRRLWQLLVQVLERPLSASIAEG
jgi:hypothetical protein